MDPIVWGIIGVGAYLYTKAGSKDRFRYRCRNGSWRAYFNGNPPSYHHVLRDSKGHYVCWDRSLGTEKDARQVAKRWMELYG